MPDFEHLVVMIADKWFFFWWPLADSFTKHLQKAEAWAHVNIFQLRWDYGGICCLQIGLSSPSSKKTLGNVAPQSSVCLPHRWSTSPIGPTPSCVSSDEHLRGRSIWEAVEVYLHSRCAPLPSAEGCTGHLAIWNLATHLVKSPKGLEGWPPTATPWQTKLSSCYTHLETSSLRMWTSKFGMNHQPQVWWLGLVVAKVLQVWFWVA